MSKYNVVVVGGGPGGSLAAKTAAEKGLKTVLIEKGKWAGAKNSSGCGLGSRWWRDFPDIFEGIHKLPSCRLIKGVEINILDDENEVVTKYTTPHTKEDRKLYTYKGEEVGAKCAAVYRSDLDPYLAELACAAGAELRTAIVAEDVIMKDSQVCGVKLETGEKLDADVVIAADGAYSTMAIRAGMRGRWRKQDITLCPQLDFSCNEEKLDNLYGQYNALWLAPAGGFYQVNFRDGYHLGNGQWFHVWSVKPIDYFKKMLTSPAFIRMCKAVDAVPREYQSHMLPWMEHPPKTYMGGMLLVGDAGGFPCPLEGEGVWHACMSGRIAAEVAADAISKGDSSEAFLSDYERRWKQSHLGREFDFGHEWVNLWLGSVFSHENMVLMSQLIGELQWFNPFTISMDWSDDHMSAINRHLEHIFDLLDKTAEMGKALAPLIAGLGRGISSENKLRFAKLIGANVSK